jgi:multiple sugar transport system substrate-binding protein
VRATPTSIDGAPARKGRHGRRLRLATVLLACLTLVAAAGCGSDEPAPSGGGNEKIELNIFWWGGPARAEYTQKALELYTKNNPNVTFKQQWQAYGGFSDKLATLAAGGNAPDIFQMDDNLLGEFASRGVALDLGPFAGSVIKTDGLAGGLAESGKIDGKLYGLPTAQNTTALVYDKTVLADNGLPEPTVGMSWEDYFSWAKQVTDSTGGKVHGSSDGSHDYKVLQVWLRQQGKALYNGNQLGFTEADLTQWFTLWNQQREAKAVAPADVVQPTITGDVTKQLVVTKQGGTAFMHSNQLTELAKGTDHELGVVTYPGETSSSFVRAATFWSGSAKTRYPEEVAKVINFLVNDVEANKTLAGERGLPPNLQVREQIQASLGEAVQRVAAFENEVGPKLGQTPPPPPPGHVEIRSILQKTAESVMFGRMSPDQGAKDFVTQAGAVLAK